MPDEVTKVDLEEQFLTRRRVLLNELKDRSLWFVRVRWWVPLVMSLGLVVARVFGVEVAVLPLLGVALLVLGYNLALWSWHRRFADQPALQTENLLRRFTRWQVACDYLAMFLLLHFTGGASSPFIFFFIFHIIFASILLKRRTAFYFAALASAGVGLLAVAESSGWLPSHPIGYRGQVIALMDQTLPLLVWWVVFTASVFLSALATTNIMEMVRRRIHQLADLSEATLLLNRKLGSLHAIGQSILSVRRLVPVLEIVCAELARVLDVQGVAVKLLSEDEKRLQFAVAHGLPDGIFPGREVEVSESPLNRRIIAGEPYVTGDVTRKDQFQLGEELSVAHIKSVLFVPLASEEKVIGILSAYCNIPDRFGREDVDFLVLGAELAAIAVENARAYEAIADLSLERERIMLRVAHNLRAPLAAMLSILEVVRDGYLGDLNTEQQEYLRRVERRASNLTDLIDELLILAESQDGHRRLARAPVDLAVLARRIRRTFQDEAEQKDLRFEVTVVSRLPELIGDKAMIEQMLENLVSNAVKYTPAEGEVSLTIEANDANSLLFTVSDSGIGIPSEALPDLFVEFFRAENARTMEETGTGLGLAIVKEIVERHDGRIEVASEEGEGAHFMVTLPGSGSTVAGRT